VALATGSSEVLWQAEAPNYSPALYESRRIHATAKDGTKIPMSLLYKKAFSPFRADGSSTGAPRPCVLDGYGSYGSCNDPYFSSMKLSLLDRGVVYAIGHIRGGSEMGRQWYEDHGKYLTKINTFDDFAACAQHLHDTGISAPSMLAGVGRSAGGLLIGATANRSPHLFKVHARAIRYLQNRRKLLQVVFVKY
jgi:oligopeptidase B